MLNRELKTDLRDILSMISCADDYGHNNQIFRHWAAHMCETLTEEEIEAYAREVADEPGYEEEDYECTKERLMEWYNHSFTDGLAT